MKKSEVDKITYTPAEAMKILGIGRNTIYKMLSSGEIFAKRIGMKKWIIPKRGLEEWLTKI